MIELSGVVAGYFRHVRGELRCGSIRAASGIKVAVLVAALLAATLALAGELVFVKSRGVVDLAPFKCMWTESSLVKRLCYDKANSYLLVSLKGTYYHYCGLPVSTLKEWSSADSLGSYFNASIKGRYDCRITPPPSYQ